jgi:hypothetical protein
MIALTILAGILSSAKPAAPVQVEHANLHRVVFATPEYAVLQNTYPARSESGFHTHSHDLFYVLISTAKFGTSRPGQGVRMAPDFPIGAVGMNDMSSGSVVHNVINVDDRPFKIVALEIRTSGPSGKPITARSPESRYLQIHDHAKLRAWRVVLQPGESAPPLSIAGSGVRIFVRGGMLSVQRPGKPSQTYAVADGDFEQFGPQPAQSLVNSGTTAIELIDVELK